MSCNLSKKKKKKLYKRFFFNYKDNFLMYANEIEDLKLPRAYVCLARISMSVNV